MTTDQARQALRELLRDLSNDEIRVICMKALREWRATPARAGGPAHPDQLPHNEIFQMHGDLGRRAIPLLAKRKGATEPSSEEIHTMKEPFLDCLGLPWMSGVLEFAWWLERAGLAVVIQRQQDGYPVNLRLTKRGARLLDRGDDDPLLPGGLENLVARCPGLPAGALALLVDARTCFDHSLLRPAVVLMGVAYELAIEEVINVLVTKGLVHPNTPAQEAGERLKRVRDFVRSEAVKHVLPNRDDRRRAEAAYDFADTLRLRRNEAAHTRPAYDFEHAAETEEFLVSAGRHLPALWSLAL